MVKVKWIKKYIFWIWRRNIQTLIVMLETGKGFWINLNFNERYNNRKIKIIK